MQWAERPKHFLHDQSSDVPNTTSAAADTDDHADDDFVDAEDAAAGVRVFLKFALSFVYARPDVHEFCSLSICKCM